jgi:hypothetical protein
VAGEKIFRINNFVKKFDKIGTYFQKQVPCLQGEHFENYLAFLSPVEIGFASNESVGNISYVDEIAREL